MWTEKEKTASTPKWEEIIAQAQLAVNFIQEDRGKECQHPAIAPNLYVFIPEERNRITTTEEENLTVLI